MHALTVVAAFLGGGAAVTFIGAKLIERAHPPCGRFLEIGGLRQYVVELGEGTGVVNAPAIVLLHGAGCNLEDMRLALGERLAARHRVILLDRPGLGWSERRSSDGSSPAYQAAMLNAVLERLGVDRSFWSAIPGGGLLALTFALDYPHRVAGLVVIAPPTHPWLGQTKWLYSVFAIPVFGWGICPHVDAALRGSADRTRLSRRVPAANAAARLYETFGRTAAAAAGDAACECCRYRRAQSVPQAASRAL